MKKRVHHYVSSSLLLCSFICLELTTSSLAGTLASPSDESKPVISFESSKCDPRQEPSRVKREGPAKSPNVEGELPVLKSSKLTNAGSEKRAAASLEAFTRSRRTVPESSLKEMRAEHKMSFSVSADPTETEASVKPPLNTGKPQKTIKSKKSMTASIMYMTPGLEDGTGVLKDSTPPAIDFGELNPEDYSITYVSLNSGGDDVDDYSFSEEREFHTGEESADYTVGEESLDESFSEEDKDKKVQASLTGMRPNDLNQIRVGEGQVRATKLGFGQRLTRRHFGRNAAGRRKLFRGSSRNRFPLMRGNAEKNAKLHKWPAMKMAA